MTSKRITVLHTIETGGPGGAETLLLTLASRLDPNRFKAVVAIPTGRWLHAMLSESGIDAISIKSTSWFDPRPLLQLWGITRHLGVDVIHSHLPAQNFYASIVGRLCGVPTIATYHGPVELQQSHNRKGRLALRTVRRSATASLVVCDSMAAKLKSAGFQSDKIIRIYNGVDVGSYLSSGSGELRRSLGVTERTPIVGMVANIRAPKGYDYFIRAAKLVVSRLPQVQFVSIGDPQAGLSERLEQLVCDLQLEGNFTFLGYRKDAHLLLSDLNVFVLSSLNEGFPFAAIEAMAAGKPSVMTRCGGPEEVVEEGVTGYLVPVADEAALASRVTALLLDPARAEEMGRAARARVEREFSLAGMLRNYESLYARLASGNR